MLFHYTFFISWPLVPFLCDPLNTLSWCRKAAGLSIIRGSICCEDHFEWYVCTCYSTDIYFRFHYKVTIVSLFYCRRHRINCLNADVEGSAYIYKKDVHSKKRSPLSDFIFWTPLLRNINCHLVICTLLYFLLCQHELIIYGWNIL